MKWSIFSRGEVKQIIANQEKIMSSIDDLNTAVTNLKTTFEKYQTDVLTALKNATDVSGAITAVEALNTEIAAADNGLSPTPSAAP